MHSLIQFCRICHKRINNSSDSCTKKKANSTANACCEHHIFIVVIINRVIFRRNVITANCETSSSDSAKQHTKRHTKAYNGHSYFASQPLVVGVLELAG